MGELRFYRTCSELSIHAFHKIIEKGDYSYLIVGWDEYSEIKFEREKAASIWASIYSEYCKLTSNNKALMYYKEKKRLIYLETRKYIVSKMLLQMSMSELNNETIKEFIEEIREWKFVYKSDKKDDVQIDDVLRQIRAGNNEIGLIKSSLKNMEDKSEPISITKQIVKVEQALGRNVIDPKTTSVEKWIHLMDEIKSINEQRRKQQMKSKRK